MFLKAGVTDNSHIQQSEENAIGNALFAGNIKKDDVVRHSVSYPAYRRSFTANRG